MKKKTTEQKQYDRIDKIFTDARQEFEDVGGRITAKRAEVEAIVDGIEEQRRMKWNQIAYALVILGSCAVVLVALTVWG
jgi:hypothetical protein